MCSNKSNIRITLLTLIFLLGLTNINIMFAQRSNSKMPADNKKGMSKRDSTFDNLKLTQAQKKNIKELRFKLAKQVIPLKDQVKEKKAHIKTLSVMDNPDMNAINSTVDEIASLRAQMAKLALAHQQLVRKVLNDDQRILYDAKVQKLCK